MTDTPPSAEAILDTITPYLPEEYRGPVEAAIRGFADPVKAEDQALFEQLVRSLVAGGSLVDAEVFTPYAIRDAKELLVAIRSAEGK